MSSTQLELFAAEPTRAVTFVQICHECGEPVAAVPQDDVAEPWVASILWCYVALRDHQEKVHGRNRHSLENA